MVIVLHDVGECAEMHEGLTPAGRRIRACAPVVEDTVERRRRGRDGTG